ncbi:MAG: ParB/RepB/Spo0J family partition protein [Lachnospiraceae bacterium]|jgi:ParB family chromosome partitioning protein|nr:ParB/RepB/Spo0J family partition protein [Lachnospiraceae bacterium]
MEKTKRKALGRGLEAYFGNDVVEQVMQAKPQARPTDGVHTMLKVNEIEPNRDQPRKEFDQEKLNSLAETMKQHGVIEPLIVSPEDGYYRLIAGERRWRAAKLAGIKEVPCIVRQYEDQESMEISLIENLQRENLNPIEEANAYQELINKFKLTQEEVAARVAKSRVTVTNLLRLLRLDAAIQQMIIEGSITYGHARALLGIDDADLQMQIAIKIESEKLNVRDVEKLVKQAGRQKKRPVGEEPPKENAGVELAFSEYEERMRRAIGTKVIINKRDQHKGKIEIEYYTPQELERIVELIENIG